MRPWSMLVLGGCFVRGGGTAVGNPGDADVKARAADAALDLAVVDVPVEAWVGERCDGELQTREVGRILDGLAPSAEPVRVPPGAYCAQMLALSGPIEVRGITAAGTGFEVALDLGELAVDGRIAVDGDLLLFEVPLPVEAAALDALGEPQVALAPEDPLATGWAAEARDGAALWVDGDGDGLLSPADRPVIARDTGVLAALAESDRGCGCDSGAAGGLGWVLAALVLRRSGPRRGRPRSVRSSREAVRP